MLRCVLMTLCLTSCAAVNVARQTEVGSYVEELIEETTEDLIEFGSAAIGTPVDVEVDYDPIHNKHKKCKKCSLHCKKS